MNVDAARLITKLEAELAAMTRRAVIAETAVEQLQEEPVAREGGAKTEEVR